MNLKKKKKEKHAKEIKVVNGKVKAKRNDILSLFFYYNVYHSGNKFFKVLT